MRIVSKSVKIIVEEKKTICYDDKSEANTHDNFMIASGWSRRDVYEHDGKIYQTFERVVIGGKNFD